MGYTYTMMIYNVGGLLFQVQGTAIYLVKDSFA